MLSPSTFRSPSLCDRGDDPRITKKGKFVSEKEMVGIGGSESWNHFLL